MNQSTTRMQVVLEALNTTANAFAKTHALNVGTIYGFANGTRNPGYDILMLICESEPRISAEYLLRGKGEPLLDTTEALTTIEQLEALKAEMNQAIDRRIEQLQ